MFPSSCTYLAVSPRRILTTPARLSAQDGATKLESAQLPACACRACAPGITASMACSSLNVGDRGHACSMQALKALQKRKAAPVKTLWLS